MFYQAGIAVLTGSIFSSTASGGFATGSVQFNSNGESFIDFMTGSSISGTVDAIRHRIFDFSFNNTTELNSTVYFCRVNHNEFNYSSNPTYVSASKIVTKNVSSDTPVSYISTIGLYSPDNELLAVAKLSEPLKKDPTTELTLRVRLDY